MKEQHCVSISEPGELIAFVPYLLGFPPQESLVLLWLCGERVGMTARVDLSELPTAAEVDELLWQLHWNVRASELIAVAYSDDGPRAVEVLGHVRKHTVTSIKDAVTVVGDRWTSLLCQERGCCPPGSAHASGSVQEAHHSPAAVSAVYAGMNVSASREDVVAVVYGPDDDLRAQMNELLAARASEGEVDVDWLPHIMSDAALTGYQLSLEEIARALVDLLDPDQRDVVLCTLDAENAHRYAPVFARLVAHAPALFSLAPLCLLGMASWLSGEGAVSAECARRLTELDPTYRMGNLLVRIQQAGIPPSAWPGWGQAA